MSRHPHVPAVAGIDLGFAPADYFLARDLRLALPSDIQGKARRDLARALAASGDALPDELLAPVLDESDRRAWGLIHPMMMGGEYLPPLRRGEVEIARISLASVTSDQISIRARRIGARIAYAAADEYDSGEQYVLAPRTTRAPLSMRTLVAQLDGACERGGAVLCHVAWQVEDGSSTPESMRGFVTVESDFYPDLGPYYAARLDRYLDEAEARERDGEM